MVSPDVISDIEFTIEQAEQMRSDRCAFNAPLICYKTQSGHWWLTQGCCNHWECPRCGVTRAKQEYARMVSGANKLESDGHTLYFVTLTCRGRELSLADAEQGYMKWCNRLLSAMRARCKKERGHWCYVIVTERQERGHPHSHAIMAWMPDDRENVVKGTHLKGDLYASRDRVWSEWLHKRILSAGLGEQWDCTIVRNPSAVAVYVAKYLFKDAMSTRWPKSWKRIRYSQSWPKLPDVTSDNEAFPVLSSSDWKRVADIGTMVNTDDDVVMWYAYTRDVLNVVLRARIASEIPR